MMYLLQHAFLYLSFCTMHEIAFDRWVKQGPDLLLFFSQTLLLTHTHTLSLSFPFPEPLTHTPMAFLGTALRSCRSTARSASATTRSLSSTTPLLAKTKNPYTDTLLLPKTTFPLRANAVSREHLFKDRCTSELYEWQVKHVFNICLVYLFLFDTFCGE